MQYILNKIGECAGCIYFNRTYDHEKCRSCERNPVIATFLKDNKTKPVKDLLPNDAFSLEQQGELARLTEANQREAASMGVDPEAIARMVAEHDKRGPPDRRRRS